jgi:hypothetical protein
VQVSMHYIGKLKSNGKIFDSNVGKKPFDFRLGVGEVIKGWDVGVNGMYYWLLCFCCVQDWIVCQYSPRICHGVSGESWSHLYGETI